MKTMLIATLLAAALSVGSANAATDPRTCPAAPT
jgi:hypothetical protein